MARKNKNESSRILIILTNSVLLVAFMYNLLELNKNDNEIIPVGNMVNMFFIFCILIVAGGINLGFVDKSTQNPKIKKVLRFICISMLLSPVLMYGLILLITSIF